MSIILTENLTLKVGINCQKNLLPARRDLFADGNQGELGILNAKEISKADLTIFIL